jgi:spermidine synthase
MKTSIPRAWFFLLFTLSGFAGLIYESIWSHYLKLFLGHAAYAQTLVLAIFMGGMAIGSWLCSRYSGNWGNLLVGYAAAEAVIGICALVFHKVFVGATDFAYDSIMPSLGSPLAATTFKWAYSALLILPQSVLLGMTFPLMTAGLIRAYPDRSGETIAMLYFTNSLGAAAGVLASGFVLIGLVGLPGTILTAGLLNILLAAIVWGLAKAMPNTAVPGPRAERSAPRGKGYGLMLVVALLTGAASFIYEIGWIRMLSMVLGSSTHAFELMLSAFILGLAFGGLWIKRHIDRTGSPEKLLGVVQIVMGLFALATLVVYGQTFALMQTLMDALARSESGYAAFNLGSHFIALVVMFPAAFCAGMTLPLITQVLLRRGTGERAIGAVYAANTVGAIVGVFAAVHLGMPLLGLKGLITFGAAIDIGLGVALLWSIGTRSRLAIGAALAGVAGIVGTIAFVQLDPYKMASGVYRYGQILERGNSTVLYHRDGKTATINMVQTSGRLAIRTNGKPDAALNPDINGPMTVDETTMVLTGALPLFFHPNARTAANIGFGSGLTSHVLLASDTLREVDTIEIETAMVDAARGFSPRNDNVYRDPRSRIHIEDAKTFFSVHNKRYDIITSEPSNPWVSGVASLFTDEFYSRVKRHLNEGGVFLQWIQLYEINPPLIASVFKALSRNFTDYAVYAPYDSDIIIIARNGSPLPAPSDALFGQPRLAKELERIQIRSLADLSLHRIGGRKAIQPYFDDFSISANSDYFPVLDQHAAKTRFMQADALDVVNLASTQVPAVEILGGDPQRGPISAGERPWLRKAVYVKAALAGRDYLLDGDIRKLQQVPQVLRSDFELTRVLGIECAHRQRTVTVDQLAAVGGALVPFLTGAEQAPVWQRLEKSPCFARMGKTEREWLRLLQAVGNRDTQGMARIAEGLLGVNEPAVFGRRDFLVATAITGHLAGDLHRAVAMWREFAPKVVSNRSDMLPELLRGHIFARIKPVGVDGAEIVNK